MTAEKLWGVLESSGIPFAYHQWEKRVPPPYGVYLERYTNIFYAEGVPYFWDKNYQIELYVQQKDPEAEGRVEAALTGVGIGFDKSETYLEAEKLYRILYEIEV